MTPIEWANKCVDDTSHKQPTRNQIACIVQKAVEEERERDAKLAENMKIIGGDTPGPLFNAGWNECAERTAKLIREGSK